MVVSLPRNFGSYRIIIKGKENRVSASLILKGKNIHPTYRYGCSYISVRKLDHAHSIGRIESRYLHLLAIIVNRF